MKDFEEHVKNGCLYGQQDGPDDTVKECECEHFKDVRTEWERELAFNQISIKNTPGEWQKEVDYELGKYKGYTYVIDRKPLTGGHLCGYVLIPEGHKLYGKEGLQYEDSSTLEVHGGITYAGKAKPPYCMVPDEEYSKLSDGWWIGFDCAHYLDLLPLSVSMEATQREFYANNPDILKDAQETYCATTEFGDVFSIMTRGKTYKNIKFVRKEIRKLIKQLMKK